MKLKKTIVTAQHNYENRLTKSYLIFIHMCELWKSVDSGRCSARSFQQMSLRFPLKFHGYLINGILFRAEGWKLTSVNDDSTVVEYK